MKEVLITPLDINGDIDETNLHTGVTYANNVYTLTDQQVTVSTNSEYETRRVFQMFYDIFDITRTALDRYQVASGPGIVYVQIGFPTRKIISFIHLLGIKEIYSVKFEIDTVGDGSFVPVSGTYNDYTNVGIWQSDHALFLFDEALENVYQLKMYMNTGLYGRIYNAILYGVHM
jgi:hypothetical protein